MSTDGSSERIRRLIANEPAYYAHKDQVNAAYQDAVANGREPTREQRNESRRRKTVAQGQVVAEARLIVWREYRRWRAEGGQP